MTDSAQSDLDSATVPQAPREVNVEFQFEIKSFAALQHDFRAMNLKQLAQTLGLSQTTVSRALNGYPEVSAATRARVVAAAEAAQYVPSGRAKSLATGRTMTIGHVIPLSNRREIVNPIFGDFLAGAGAVYAANGYNVLLNLVPDDDDLRAYREMQARAEVDGIVVHAPRMNDRRIGHLRELGLPFVVHGRASGMTDPYDWIDVENRAAVEAATAHLVGLGHRRLALLNGVEAFDFARQRRAGFEAALAAAGIAPDPAWMRSGDMTEPYGYRAARAMLAADPAPTAFVTASIVTAIGVRRAVEDLGLRLGREVSLVTWDDALSYLRNEEQADAEGPAIFTAMRSAVHAAGARAADILLARIADPDAPPMTALLETTFVPGRSSGPAPD